MFSRAPANLIVAVRQISQPQDVDFYVPHAIILKILHSEPHDSSVLGFIVGLPSVDLDFRRHSQLPLL